MQVYDGHIFLGSFASPATAARAHDTAAMRMHCDAVESPAVPEQQLGSVLTNYPASSYEEGMQATREAGIDDFVTALQRIGALETQRGSRCRPI